MTQEVVLESNKSRKKSKTIFHLLQWNESGAVGSTNTGTTVLNGFVGQDEFTQVVTDHFRFNFNLAEIFAVIDTDDRAGHFGNDNHVSQVGLDNFGFLIWRSLFLGFAQFLDQGHWLAFQTTGETSAGTAVHQFNQLVAKKIKKKQTQTLVTLHHL